MSARHLGRMSPRRLYRLAVAMAAALVVVFAIWLALDLGGPSTTRAFDGLAIALAAFAAGAACLRSARRGQYGFGRAWTIAMRRAWRLIGAAALTWGVGQLVWSALELPGSGAPAGFPSVADLFFLAAIPLLAAGVLSWPTAPVHALAQLRTLLDGLLIASSLLFASWALVLGPTYHAAGGSLAARVIGLAYPIGDMVTLTIVFSVLVRTRWRAIVQPGLIALAIVCMGLADSAFAYLAGKGAYVPGAWLDLGWLVGWLLVAVAALRPAPAELPRDDEEDSPVSWWRFALPYVPPVAAFVTATFVQAARGRLEPFLIFNGTVIVLLVVARQAVANVENQRLHQRVRRTVDRLFQREAELEMALLRQREAAKSLHEVSQMKDTFLRAVSHDLRTPLTAMHGVAVTLERTKLNLPREQALDLIKMMIEKTRKMDRLLTDLLDLNRMGEGILEPKRTTIDIRALAHQVVDEVDQLRGWPIEIDAEPVLVSVDAPKVERIIENLLLNTTRHTSPGTQVWVRARTGERDLELIVEDAGPGVPAELAGSIFEPFRQGKPVLARGKNGKGVGIGLSLVARFAILHGGRAWVAERPGGGASFHVLLPGCVSRDGAAAEAPEDAAVQGTADGHAGDAGDAGDARVARDAGGERLPGARPAARPGAGATPRP